jgi:hypothetical protein
VQEEWLVSALLCGEGERGRRRIGKSGSSFFSSRWIGVCAREVGNMHAKRAGGGVEWRREGKRNGGAEKGRTDLDKSITKQSSDVGR